MPLSAVAQALLRNTSEPSAAALKHSAICELGKDSVIAKKLMSYAY